MKNEERDANISFAKNGHGSPSTRISLPVPWVKELGCSEDDRSVKISFKNKKIIIEKK